MDINDLKFLTSPEGQQILNRYSDLNNKELDNLAFKLQKDRVKHYAAIITLLELRLKSKEKFSRSNEMFFTPMGFEQSTGEVIAKYIAERFQKNLDFGTTHVRRDRTVSCPNEGGKIVDLTSGIGGNTIFLAKENKVLAIENNPVILECAKLNARSHGVEKNIEFVLGNAEDNIIKDAAAFFIDPARDREGKTKTRSIINSRPNIIELLPKIFDVTKNVCIKISPAFDYKELANLAIDPEVEVISEDNVVKVVLLWFGNFKTCKRRATCIKAGVTYTLTDKEETLIPISEIKKYIYEPDKAIIKAHLIDEVAEEFYLKKIDSHVGFLTSDELIKNKQLFRIFTVLDSLNFSLKRLKKYLKENNIKRANIITRAFPVQVEDLYKQLKIKEGAEKYFIFTTINKQRICMICERMFA